MARVIANLSYQGVYLVDIGGDRFIYTSNHPLLRGLIFSVPLRSTIESPLDFLHILKFFRFFL